MGVEDIKNLTTEELIIKEISYLKNLLLGYSDEIPEEIIHNQGNYKCRALWWSLLNAAITNLEHDKLLPDDLIKKADRVLENYNTSQERNGLVTRENIDEAIKIVTEIINFLENKIKK